MTSPRERPIFPILRQAFASPETVHRICTEVRLPEPARIPMGVPEGDHRSSVNLTFERRSV